MGAGNQFGRALARILLANKRLVEISEQFSRAFAAAAGGPLDAYAKRAVLRQPAIGQD